jgi:peptide/nickel transport system permease protein
MNFARYILKRILLLLFVLIGASLLSFFIVRVVPGDPARMMLPPQASPEDVIKMRENLGLDEAYYVQYIKYINDILHGDFGFSNHTGRTVLEEFKRRLPASIELSILSLSLATIAGIWLGVISALKKNKIIDHFARIFSIGGISAPGFWIGLLAIYLFYYILDWVPAPSGRISMLADNVNSITGLYLLDAIIKGDWQLFKDVFMHLLLPVLVLSYSFLAMICRLTRAGMLEILEADYIKFFRTSGVKRWRIIWIYALRNAIRPVLTMLGMFFANLLGGVVFIETVFNWPGIGRYAIESINFLDYPPIQGFIIFMALGYVVVNLVVDLLYMVLDPRVQY